jgi:hypothetical protein
MYKDKKEQKIGTGKEGNETDKSRYIGLGREKR